MIKAVIFDVGGVLLKTFDWSFRQRWDEKLGLPKRTIEELVFNSPLGMAAQLGQVTIEEHWQLIGRELGLTAAELATLRHDFWAGDAFDLELINWIRQLRPRYQTAVISNAFTDLRQVLTVEFNFGDVFDLITVSAEEGVMKPHPAIYERTLTQLGVQPAEAIFIDDNLRNIEAAQALGLKTVHYQREVDVPAVCALEGVSL